MEGTGLFQPPLNLAPPEYVFPATPFEQARAEQNREGRAMKQSIRIRVDYIAPSLNAIYAGIHWAKRKKHADDAHLAVKIAAKGIRMAVSAVVLEFQPMIRGRCYDVSNHAYWIKLIEDGLVRAGVLPDDTNKWVKRIIINAPVKIKKPEQSHMIVEITET